MREKARTEHQPEGNRRAPARAPTEPSGRNLLFALRERAYTTVWFEPDREKCDDHEQDRRDRHDRAEELATRAERTERSSGAGATDDARQEVGDDWQQRGVLSGTVLKFFGATNWPRERIVHRHASGGARLRHGEQRRERGGSHHDQSL
jgi:hypothetical protein